jgi:hypothetical protein
MHDRVASSTPRRTPALGAARVVVLARGLEAAFAAAFEALVGVPPARRRK